MQDENSYEKNYLKFKNLLSVEQMMEGMPGGFFIYKAEGDEEILYINNGMLRIFGCETKGEFAELTGNTFCSMVHPDDIEEVEASIERQIASNQYALDYVEYRIVRKDGSIRWVQDYGHFIHTEEYGNLFYVFIEDATDRLTKKMEELENLNRELREAYSSEHQYRKAILNDASAFFEIDVTADCFISEACQVVDGGIVDLFDYMGLSHFEKYSDYLEYWSKQEGLSEPLVFREYFSRDSLLESFKSGEREVYYESWTVDNYGRKRLFSYSFLLGKNDYNQHIVALFIAKDITEQDESRKLLQMALKQAKAAGEARSVFLSNMSHDIRTPLNGIMGGIDLIRDAIEDKNNIEADKISDYLDKMQFSGMELTSIVEESLEITRMESGRVTLSVSPGSVLDCLWDVENEIKQETEPKKINFTVERQDIVHKDVVADFTRLKEVLCQLLDNAVKYTPEGGSVCLIAKELEDAPVSSARFSFTIRDTGIGISKEHLEDIFDPFERINNTTKSGILGLGLGLALVKGIVNMMGGHITVDSEPGKGSEFTFSVVLSLADDNKAVPQDTLAGMEDIPLEGKRALLVEDNEINMEIISQLLKARGIEVEQAENGLISLNRIKKMEPGYYDFVLMDIQMPVMNGYEAAREIRKLEDPLVSTIPIIAVSANAFSEDQEMALDSGMNAHCPKPIDKEKLLEVIEQELKRHYNTK